MKDSAKFAFEIIEAEVKDVFGRVELAVGGEAAAEFTEDLADAAEDAGAFEAEVFTIPDAGAGLFENPVEEEFFLKSGEIADGAEFGRGGGK